MSAAPSASAAELQRGAAGERRHRREALQERRARRLEVRAADRRDTLAAGQARVRIVGAARTASPDRESAAVRRWPARAAPDQAERRRRDTPTTGVPSRTSAMLTVYSSRPGEELARAVERIDQQESSRRATSRPVTLPPRRPARREAPRRGRAGSPPRAASSAAVTGDSSAFCRDADVAAVEPQDRRLPARTAMSVNSSRSGSGVVDFRVCRSLPRPIVAGASAAVYHPASLVQPLSRMLAVVRTGDSRMSGPVTLEVPRSGGAAVLARLPRPDQPGRRGRERHRGDGGRRRRADQGLRASS